MLYFGVCFFFTNFSGIKLSFSLLLTKYETWQLFRNTAKFKIQYLVIFFELNYVKGRKIKR